MAAPFPRRPPRGVRSARPTGTAAAGLLAAGHFATRTRHCTRGRAYLAIIHRSSGHVRQSPTGSNGRGGRSAKRRCATLLRDSPRPMPSLQCCSRYWLLPPTRAPVRLAIAQFRARRRHVHPAASLAVRARSVICPFAAQMQPRGNVLYPPASTTRKTDLYSGWCILRKLPPSHADRRPYRDSS